jgi:hypothetical protein
MRTLHAGAVALSLMTVAACEADLEGAITSVTDALNAEAQALADDVTDAAADDDDDDDDADDDGAADDGDGEGRGPRGERGDRPPPPEGFEEIEVEACTPPVADGVDLGRRPHHRGHLAPIYDVDESRSLDDTEQAALVADLTAGCTARNAAVLADFDVDASGDLSQAEWDSARASLRAAHEAERASLDTDGDGELSETEHEAARAELMATWDLDDSGDLDADERAAMRTDLQALVRAGDPLPPLPLFGPPGGHGRGHRGPPPDRRDDDVADDANEEVTTTE